MTICGIYLIINTVNGKIYVGSSVNVIFRWQRHLFLLDRKDHDNRHLQFAWNKYGEGSFHFCIVEQCCKEDLLKVEQIWIDSTNCCDENFGYNLAEIAGSNLGVKWSEEQKKKHSERLKGRSHSQETREKLRASNVGLKRSQDFKDKMSLVMKGKQNFIGIAHSEQTKSKISQSLKGVKHSSDRRAKQAKAQIGLKRPSMRNKERWPHELGSKCKCEECRQKKNEYLVNYRLRDKSGYK